MVVLASNDFHVRLELAHEATATTMRDAMVEHVAGYATATPAMRTRIFGEIHEVWKRTRVRFASSECLGEDDLNVFRAISVQRALNGFSLADFEAGLDVAYLTGLRCCLSMIEPIDSYELMRFSAWSAAEIAGVKEVTLAAYIQAQRQVGDRDQGRQLVLRSLLEGAPTNAVAAAAGIALPKGYLVLLCRAQHPEATAITTQHSDLARVFAGVSGALWQYDGWAGKLLALLPSDGQHTASVEATAADLVEALVETMGQRLLAAESHASELVDVPDAVGQVEQAITLVAAMPDVANIPYRDSHLLIERMIASNSQFRQGLADLLAPLSGGTDLWRTLEVLFECGMNREEAARRLYIHRRTLTYRLSRIRELVGLDPATAHGTQVLRSALTASRLGGSEIYGGEKL